MICSTIDKASDRMPETAKKVHESSSSLATGAFDDLASLRVFSRVVELGSFSEVARHLGVTPATVSKHIGALEGRLGARLVNRTTRQVSVTEAGRRLYEHCVRVLRELEEAEAGLSEIQNEPAGSLRVTAPLQFGVRRISPRLPDFLRRYPRVSVDLDLSIQKVDLFREHIDIAIRITDSPEPGLVALKLAPYRRVFCASPEYLERNGVPQAPEDLVNHNCLIARGASLNASWPVKRGDVVSLQRVSGNLVANNADVVRDAALAGLGVAMSPRWLVEDDLRAGRLKEVLPGYAVGDRAVYAVLPRPGTPLLKVRCFVDFLKESFQDIQ